MVVTIVAMPMAKEVTNTFCTPDTTLPSNYWTDVATN